MRRLLSIALSLCLLLALTACGGGGPSESNTPASEPEIADAFDLDEYKAIVSSCHDSIMVNSILLSNLGKYEHNYWSNLENIGGNIDYDKLVDRAFKWLEEQEDADELDVREEYGEICKQYKEILAIDVSEMGPEAVEIANNFNTLFSSYNDLYLLITSPTGGKDGFASKFNSYSSEIKSADSMLQILLS